MKNLVQITKEDFNKQFYYEDCSHATACTRERKILSKKRFVFTILDGNSIRMVRVKANNLAEGKEKIMQTYPGWFIIKEQQW